MNWSDVWKEGKYGHASCQDSTNGGTDGVLNEPAPSVPYGTYTSAVGNRNSDDPSNSKLTTCQGNILNIDNTDTNKITGYVYGGILANGWSLNTSGSVVNKDASPRDEVSKYNLTNTTDNPKGVVTGNTVNVNASVVGMTSLGGSADLWQNKTASIYGGANSRIGSAADSTVAGDVTYNIVYTVAAGTTRGLLGRLPIIPLLLLSVTQVLLYPC